MELSSQLRVPLPRIPNLDELKDSNLVYKYNLDLYGVLLKAFENAYKDLSQIQGSWIDAKAYTTLEAANTAAYNEGKLLVISQNYTLTANTTLTAAVKVIKGGSFTKASTYTLTINGPFEAGFYQVFSGFSAGDVTFGLGAVKEVYSAWWGAVGDGAVDDTAAIQAAITAAAGSTAFFPKGVYKLTNKITIANSTRILGGGSLNFSNSLGSTDPSSSGAVFKVTFQPATATEVFYIASDTAFITVDFENIEFWNDYQTAPGAGWVPVTTPWAIRGYRAAYANAGAHATGIKNVLIRNFSHGIKLYCDASRINGLFAQCFNQTLLIDGSYDVDRVENVHGVPYWSADANVFAYMRANARLITLGRIDNPIFDKIYALIHQIGFAFQDSEAGRVPAGTMSLGRFSNIGLDDVVKGFYFNQAAPTTIDVFGSNILYSGASDAGSTGIEVAGTGPVRLMLDNFYSVASQWHAINLGTNAATRLWLNNAWIRSYNQASAGVAAIQGAAGAIARRSNVFIDTSQGNGGPAWNGVTVATDSWEDRGDPSAYDVVLAGLTVDDAWHDLDLSSIVPSGARVIRLRATFQNNTLMEYVSFRKNGNVNVYTAVKKRIRTINYMYDEYFEVPCDTGRVIEYIASNSGTWAAINICVVGW